jgi:hypothetical protein
VPSGISADFSQAHLPQGEPVWHVNCEHSEQDRFMAAKVKMLKLLQEIRGFAQITNRRPPPRSPGLFLAQMRSHMLQASPPKRKLSIRIDNQTHLDAPHQVKINHVKQSSERATVVPAP